MINVTQTQARILIYLSVVHNTRKDVTSISNKLDIDYSYLMRVLKKMVYKEWLTKHPFGRHMFYDLTPIAPLEEAKKAYLTYDSLQQTLRFQGYDQAEVISNE